MIGLTPTQTPDGDILPAILVGVVGLAAIALTLAGVLYQRHRQRRAIQRLCREHHFTPTTPTTAADTPATDASATDQEAATTPAEALHELFGPGGIILDALHRRDDELTLQIIRFRFPLYRVDAHGQWDPNLQESTHKLVLVVTGPGLHLPAFRLSPNNWMMNMIAGRTRNLFLYVEPFGRWNYVHGPDHHHIRALFDTQLQRHLAGNRHLVIDGRPGLVGYYQLGPSFLDDRFPAFLEHCLTTTRLLQARAKQLNEHPPDRRQRSVLR